MTAGEPRPDPDETGPFFVMVDTNADGTVLVRPHGECDLDTSPLLATALNQLLLAKASPVVVDLDSLVFMDASGLGVVTSMSEAFAEAHLTLVVRCRRANILKLFRICRLQHLLAS